MSEYFWWAVTSPLWIGPVLLTVFGVVALIVCLLFWVGLGVVEAVKYIKDIVSK